MTRAELALHTPCMLYVNRLIEKKFGDRVETYCGLQGSEELAEVAFHSGETVFYEDGKMVRKEYRSPHGADGLTGRRTRTTASRSSMRMARWCARSTGRRTGTLSYCQDDSSTHTQGHRQLTGCS